MVSVAGFGTFLPCPWAGDGFVAPGLWEFTDPGCPHALSALCPAEHFPCSRELSIRILAPTMASCGAPLNPSAVFKEETLDPTRMLWAEIRAELCFAGCPASQQ